MSDRYEGLARLQPPGFALGILLGIDAGLCLEARERPQTIAAWRALFGGQALPNEKTVLMARLPPAPQVVRAPRRSPWIAAGMALTALLAVGGYYALAPSLHSPAVASVDDVKQALPQVEPATHKADVEAARRKAEGDARRKLAADAEKKRLESEARQKAEAEAQARQLAEDEAKAKAHTERSPPSAFDGTYGGSLTETTTTSMSASRIVAARLSLAGPTISGEIIYPNCGSSAASMAVSPGGEINGAIRVPDAMACLPVNGTATGRVTAKGMQLELRGVGTVARGTLIKGRPAPSVAAASASAGGAFDGAYAGSLSSSSVSGGPFGFRPLGADLQISGGRLTGQLIHPTCGASPVSLPVGSSGAINGTVRIPEGIACSLNDATMTAKASAHALTLDIRSITTSAHGSLPRRAP